MTDTLLKPKLLFTVLLAGILACTAFPLLEDHFSTTDTAPLYTITDTELMKEHAAFRTLATSSNYLAHLPVATTSTTTHVRITESCDAFFGGNCLNVRSGPSTTFPVVAKVRTHTVLAVAQTVGTGSSTWHQVEIDEHLHYPERVTTDWYISSNHVEELSVPTTTQKSTSSKRIEVDVSEQLLTAYENGEVFMEIRISTGLRDTPTPLGHFSVLRKTPSRYMQGPLDNGRRTIDEEVLESHPDYYDLPGVPWNLYFTHDGAVIHGAYWHVSFGAPQSHGCVNVPPSVAEDLYHWAEVGTPIHVTQ